MFVFGIGVALPLALLGTLLREAMPRIRGRLMKVAASGKYVLGVLMIAVGASILTGFDRGLEARLVQWSPDWLSDVTTRY
jgi:MFS family permease